MMKKEDDLNTLTLMFVSSIAPATIEKIFSDNQCDFDKSIDALLTYASLDVETQSSLSINTFVETPSLPPTSHIDKGLGSSSSRKSLESPVPLQSPAGFKSDRWANSSSSSQPTPHTGPFNNDKQAFETWKSRFEGFLSPSDLQSTWSLVGREYWAEVKDLQRKVEIANIYAQQKIDVLLDDDGKPATSPGPSHRSVLADATTTKVDELDYLHSFKCLFANMIPVDELEAIWCTVSCVDIDFAQKEELAVLYACEYLEEREGDLDEYPQSSSLLDLLSMQEAQRLERKQEMDLKKHRRLETKQSTQEVALQMVMDVFKDSNLPTQISPQKVSEVLIACNYDVEAAISKICQDALKSGCFVRDASYSDIAAKHNSRMKIRHNNINFSKASSSDKLSSSSNSAKLSKMHNNNVSSLDANTSNKPNLLFRSRMQQPMFNLRFGTHFLGVLRTKNPNIIADLSGDGEIVFLGMKFQNNQRTLNTEAVQVSIDLHGLPVVQALQIVDSSIDYYRGELNGRLLKITVRYIVGKGLHSPGGIAKLGPAVQRLLRDREEQNFIPFEGEILLCISQ